MMAARGGHVECLQLLLDRGAQVNHQKKVSAFWHWIYLFANMFPFVVM